MKLSLPRKFDVGFAVALFVLVREGGSSGAQAAHLDRHFDRPFAEHPTRWTVSKAVQTASGIDRDFFRRLRRWATVLFTLTAGELWAQNVAPEEYQLKAVFLFNFTLFTEWPPQTFSDPAEPIVIGIFGEDPFGRDLDDAARGETVHGRNVVVRRIRGVDELARCHVLFVSRSQDARLGDVLGHVRRRPVLTVGESDAFTANGGIIRFVTENRKIRLQINLGAAKAAGLTLSSKLLRPAEIVSSRN